MIVASADGGGTDTTKKTTNNGNGQPTTNDNTGQPPRANDAPQTTAAVSQQALQPGDPKASTVGITRGPIDQAPTAVVTNDGIMISASQVTLQGRLQAIDGQQQPTLPNVKTDSSGRPTQVDLPNGQTRTFGYDSNGQVNMITESDGNSYHLENGRWVGKDGKPAPFQSPLVSDTGDLTYSTADHHVVTEYHDGTKEDINLSNSSVVTTDARNNVTSDLLPYFGPRVS